MDSQVAGPSHVHDQQSPGLHSMTNARASTNISGDMNAMDTRDTEMADMSILCRICASTHEHLIPMFEGEGLENKLVDKIHSHLPIKVDNTDALPDHVCYQCASTLLAWHDLVQCCIQSNISLLEQANRIKIHETTRTQTPVREKSVENGSENTRGRYRECGRNISKLLPICKEEIPNEEPLQLPKDNKCGIPSEASETSPQKPLAEGQDSQYYENGQDTSTYICTVCDEEFSVLALYQMHLAKQLICTHCDKRFCGEIKLNNHRSNCLSDFNCKMCQAKFNNAPALDEHESSCSVFFCNVCPKRFISLAFLELHRSSKHTIHCKFCKNTFDEDSFEKHKSAEHMFVCEKCSRPFTTNISFINSTEGAILCVTCLSLNVSRIKITKHVSFAKNHDLKLIIKEEHKVLTENDKCRLIKPAEYVSGGQPPRVKNDHTSSEPLQSSEVLQSVSKTGRCPYCSDKVDKMVNLQHHLKSCFELWQYMKKKAGTGAEVKNEQITEYRIEDLPVNLEGELTKNYTSNEIVNAVSIVSEIKEENFWSNAQERYSEVVDKIFNVMRAKPVDNFDHICEICSKVYKSLKSYKNHINRYHGMALLFKNPQRFRCNCCRSGRNFLADMNRHLYDRHEDIFQCDHCSEVCSSRTERSIHIFTAHPDRPAHECNQCSAKFSNREQLKTHLRWHCHDELIDCNVCGKQIKGKKRFAHHDSYHKTRVKENDVNLCPECGKSMSTLAGLRAHVRYVHGDGKTMTVLCPDCGLLVKARCYPRHRERMHGGGGLHRCPVCSRGFLAKELLRQHMDTHARGRPYRCDRCPSAFKQLRNLRMHKRNRHSAAAMPKRNPAAEGGPPAERKPRPPVECAVCLQNFPPRRLRAHMATHEPPKPDVSCTQCNKTFTSAGSLSSHVKWVHLGDRNFPCSYCSAKFKRRDAQVVHERRHTNERPYSCGVCNRLFRQRTDCKRHEAKHALPGFRCDRRRRDQPASANFMKEYDEKSASAEFEETTASGEDHQATTYLSYIVKN